MKQPRSIAILALVIVAFVAGWIAHRVNLIGQTEAADEPMKLSATKALDDRDVYYPGTEELAPDEMRVIACGTGMPDARRGQASACFLFEFGNGEKLIFDLGTGGRLPAREEAYDR